MNDSELVIYAQEINFWDRIKISDPEDCWNWTGSKTSNGYGRFKHKGKEYGAHRIAYLITHGSIPDGMFILHTCDNPSCCNPKHLHVGTTADNMREASERHRFPPRRGIENHQSKLKVGDIADMRSLYAEGCISQSEVARCYDISISQTRRILFNRSWISPVGG